MSIFEYMQAIIEQNDWWDLDLKCSKLISFHNKRTLWFSLKLFSNKFKQHYCECVAIFLSAREHGSKLNLSGVLHRLYARRRLILINTLTLISLFRMPAMLQPMTWWYLTALQHLHKPIHCNSKRTSLEAMLFLILWNCN